MKLTAERSEAPFQIGGVEVQLPRQPEEAEIVGLTLERKDFRALWTEVRVERGARAAVAAGLQRGGHAPNELPQPQVDFAFGLLNTNPLLIMFVS